MVVVSIATRDVVVSISVLEKLSTVAPKMVMLVTPMEPVLEMLILEALDTAMTGTVEQDMPTGYNL